MTKEEAWDLVCEYMSYSGKHRDVLTSPQLWQVYCLGDGFGKQTPKELQRINGGWDWSHIRDSSTEAVFEMAKVIQGVIGQQTA
jgi:hypothetical protein